MLEAHVGALEPVHRGPRPGGGHRSGTVPSGATGEDQASSAPLDCLGQLALLEAFRGNLRQAERQAAAVLRSGAACTSPGCPMLTSRRRGSTSNAASTCRHVSTSTAPPTLGGDEPGPGSRLRGCWPKPACARRDRAARGCAPAAGPGCARRRRQQVNAPAGRATW